MPKEAQPTRLKLLAFAGILVVALIVVFFFDYESAMNRALDFVASLGFWGPAFFICIYAIATVLLVPGSILTIGAGWAFGIIWGTVWVTVAANLGALFAFLSGRYLAREWAMEKISGNRVFQAIADAVEEDSWRVVGLVRLTPVIPFNLVNYAFGLTSVRLLPYVVMSILGMIPGTLLYVYIGSVARGGSNGRSTAEWVFWVAGLFITVLVTVLVTKAARRKLNASILKTPPEKP